MGSCTRPHLNISVEICRSHFSADFEGEWLHRVDTTSAKFVEKLTLRPGNLQILAFLLQSHGARNIMRLLIFQEIALNVYFGDLADVGLNSFGNLMIHSLLEFVILLKFI